MILDFKDTYNKKIVLALGFFDCVHLGHKRIFDRLAVEAAKICAEPFVFTFSNNPFSIINNNTKLIYTFSERYEILNDEYGFSCIKAVFDTEFSSKSANEFLNEITSRFNIAAIVVGKDFTYGDKKSGNVDTLRQYMDKIGVPTFVEPLYMVDGEKVSSSNIRSLISLGKIKEVNRLLGRAYSLSGIVVKGRGDGHKIGFPTVNIDFEQEKLIPYKAVYASIVRIDNNVYPAITNIGTHPTFNSDVENLETYIHGINDDLYGKKIVVELLCKIREIKRFASVEDLKIQLKSDISTRLNMRGYND